jgi:hypothetical protein
MADVTTFLSGNKARTVLRSVGAPVQAGVVLTLPVPQMGIAGTVGASISVSLTLPTFKLSIAGGGTSAAVGMRLPSLKLQATGLIGANGAVRLTLPVPQLVMRPASGVSLALPSLSLSTSGATGVIGSVSLRLPSLRLASTASQSVIGGVALQLRPRVISITGIAGQAAGVALTLRRLALAVEGRTGSIGGVSLALPVMRLAAEGFGETVGVAQLTLPALHLVMTGRVSAGAPQTFAMHTETMALTRYDNFPFTSFAQFNGVTIGACADGLFALSGATDNGAMIDAYARVGISDFGSSHLKRVDRVYVGYRSDGDLVLRVLTDETDQRDYLLRGNGTSNLHGNRVQLGKGLSARYWQFEVRNRDGADFDINTIELKPTTLRRRVGGWDA